MNDNPREAKHKTHEDCTCDYRYGSPGRLYGIDMMDCWLRVNDAPDCPHHGKEANRVSQSVEEARERFMVEVWGSEWTERNRGRRHNEAIFAEILESLAAFERAVTEASQNRERA